MPTGPCLPCNGTGVTAAVEVMDCPACERTGKIMRQPCLCCDGLGTQEINVKVICLACEVSGMKQEFPHAMHAI
jgi:DnaJ-class molecular chaperone